MHAYSSDVAHSRSERKERLLLYVFHLVRLHHTSHNVIMWDIVTLYLFREHGHMLIFPHSATKNFFVQIPFSKFWVTLESGEHFKKWYSTSKSITCQQSPYFQCVPPAHTHTYSLSLQRKKRSIKLPSFVWPGISLQRYSLQKCKLSSTQSK